MIGHQRISEQVSRVVAETLAEVESLGSVQWEVFIAMIPMQDGQGRQSIQPQIGIMVQARSPIIGHPPIGVSSFAPTHATEEHVVAAVQQMVHQIREVRGKLLAEANGNPQGQGAPHGPHGSQAR